MKHQRKSPGSPALLFSFHVRKVVATPGDPDIWPENEMSRPYHSILLVESGKGEIIVDYNTLTLKKGQVWFLSPGQPCKLLPGTRVRGWLMAFTPDFLIEHDVPQHFITDISLFQSFGKVEPLIPDDHIRAALNDLIDDMSYWLSSTTLYRRRALGALLQLFLIQCNQVPTSEQGPEFANDADVSLLRDFRLLVADRFRKCHQVSLYARKLSITSQHLSDVVKSATGLTAKAFILDRIIVEAKRKLLLTKARVKTIAGDLGFDEPEHFSRLFHDKTGFYPTHFRKEYKDGK